MTASNSKSTQSPKFDPVAFSQAMIKAFERAQPVIEDYLKKLSSEDFGEKNLDPFNIKPVYIEFLERIATDPDKFIDIQTQFWNEWFRLWSESTKKFMGEQAETVIEPDKSDRRFKAEDWQNSALFDFIKQSYLLTSRWMEKTVRGSTDMGPEKREKLAFYTRMFVDAMSPTNFIMTNPEAIRETLDTGGENLIKGFENLITDLKRGDGELKISTTDYKAFELGRNLALTPGNVVYQNDLIQLIQYAPATDKVFKRPLLVIPPWINKYYVLDLKPENSLIKWLTEQGHTVFVISWVNPDSRLAQKRFEDYMNEGILNALESIRKITGEPDCNVIGYCLGGTLLAIALSYLHSKKREKEIASATFLTTLLDFEHAGDLKLFMDDEQLEMMNREMAEKGVLEAKQLQRTFSLLRANDLIWSFVVNNYLMGREPFPFDLLYWNDDSTNMPAAMHSFYLRKMYRDNLLTVPGGITMNETPIDISKIKTPAYFLSTREDHIAPWEATFAGTKLLSGPVTFTLAASGHIAGVVNHPGKKKYCYWEAHSSLREREAERKRGKERANSKPADWLNAAAQHEGSWWPHWQKWIGGFTNGKIPARKISKSIEPAPGSYVKKKSG
jgi:polyhydroxyalkanoate synthase